MRMCVADCTASNWRTMPITGFLTHVDLLSNEVTANFEWHRIQDIAVKQRSFRGRENPLGKTDLAFAVSDGSCSCYGFCFRLQLATRNLSF